MTRKLAKLLKKKSGYPNTVRIFGQYIVMEFGMVNCYNEGKNIKRNKTMQPGKLQNARKKRYQQIPGNIRNRHDRTNKNKGQIEKRVSQKDKKSVENQTLL